MEHEWSDIKTQIKESNILKRYVVSSDGENQHEGLLALAHWMYYFSIHDKVYKGKTISELYEETIKFHSESDNLIQSIFTREEGLLLVHHIEEFDGGSVSLEGLLEYFGDDYPALSYFLFLLNKNDIGLLCETSDFYPMECYLEENLEAGESNLHNYLNDPRTKKLAIIKKPKKGKHKDEYDCYWKFKQETKPKNIKSEKVKELIEKWENIFEYFSVEQYTVPYNCFENGVILPQAMLRVTYSGHDLNPYTGGYEEDISGLRIYSQIRIEQSELYDKNSIVEQVQEYDFNLDRIDVYIEQIREYMNNYNKLCKLTTSTK